MKLVSWLRDIITGPEVTRELIDQVFETRIEVLGLQQKVEHLEYKIKTYEITKEYNA